MSFDIKDYLTPIITVVFGLILLRTTEKIKLAVAKSYDFKKKWADDFYDACKEYMSCIERYLSILNLLQSVKDDSVINKKCINELQELHIKIPEIQITIRRLSVFAPKYSGKLYEFSSNIQKYLSDMIKSKEGNFDKAIEMLNEFNKTAKESHKEILNN